MKSKITLYRRGAGTLVLPAFAAHCHVWPSMATSWGLSWPRRLCRRTALLGKGAGLMALLVVYVLVSSASNAHTEPRREYGIKAAFLYYFAEFVEWPADALGPTSITLCILGKDPFGTALDTIEGKEVKDRTLAIKLLEVGQKLEHCHVLFIGTSGEQHLDQILASLGQKSILTVGEMARFAHRGGMINFVKRKNKVRFEVNTGVTKQAGLKLSSHLLRLAKVVIDTPPRVKP